VATYAESSEVSALNHDDACDVYMTPLFHNLRAIVMDLPDRGDLGTAYRHHIQVAIVTHVVETLGVQWPTRGSAERPTFIHPDPLLPPISISFSYIIRWFNIHPETFKNNRTLLKKARDTLEVLDNANAAILEDHKHARATLAQLLSAAIYPLPTAREVNSASGIAKTTLKLGRADLDRVCREVKSDVRLNARFC